MYRDVAQWAKIRRRILVEGVSQRQAARETGISPKTIRKMLAHPHPQPYGPRSRRYPKLGPHTASIRRMLQENATLPPTARLSVMAIYERIRDQEGFRGSYGAVKDYVRPVPPDDICIWEYAYDLLVSLEKKRAIDFLFHLSRADPPVISGSRAEQFFRDVGRITIAPPKPSKKEQARRDAFEWMRVVLQKEISDEGLSRELGDLPELGCLLQRLYDGRLSDRNRSMVVLANRRGVSRSVICAFLGIDKKTYRKYLLLFEQGGAAALFARQTKSGRKFDDEAIKKAVFSLLHEPPSDYGFNRTSWRMADLCRVLREKGRPACPQVIRKITKAAGYRWRKARVVLTSHDPGFSEKLDRIRTILSGLGPDEAFFSIDEFGPFAVKMKPGLTLTAPGEQRIVPQWQKSRGCLLVTAALELSGNQVTHFYSTKKNTAEMIRMMEVLVDQYRDRRKVYLSWDGASWHISKRLFQRIEEHNAAVLDGGDGPIVETAPLPTGAQFLNVIESVFSGMARSIVHNSDYKTLDDARAAFDRYFEERNAHFRQHPRRAGNKIWRQEREPAAFSEANNCKDPRYR
jgi:transposase